MLKFKVKELWSDTLYFNSCRVEAEVQKFYTHAHMVGHTVPSAFNGGQLWRVCGAGGVGAELINQLRFRDFPRAGTVLVATVVLVLTVDTISAAIRKRIIKGRSIKV